MSLLGVKILESDYLLVQRRISLERFLQPHHCEHLQTLIFHNIYF